MTARPPWMTSLNVLVGALGVNAVLLLAANLLLGLDVFLLLIAVLLGAFAALLYVHPHRWIIANGVFALALYAVVLARLRIEGSSPVASAEMTDALVGPFGLVTVVVAAIGALTGPFAAQRARAGAVIEAPAGAKPHAAGHGRKASR